MKKYLCWTVILLLGSYNSPAQNKATKPEVNEITIGQSLPPLTIRNIINSKTSVSNTRDYKGKMLILDFWATWCTPCVAKMPKMDSIQKQFSKEIQILPVTYQSKAEVEKLMSKSAKFKTVSLPFVTGDNILRRLFPHKELPHYVWVNESGQVIAITGIEQITADTIRMMLNKSIASLKTKKDELKDFDREKGVLFQDLGFVERDVKYQSLFTDFKEGLSPRMDIINDEKKKTRKISVLNGWVKFLFRIAWSDDTHLLNESAILLEVKDTARITSTESGDKFREWLKDNSWTYELIVPDHLSGKLFQIMRNDMRNFFPQYDAGLERKVRRCLVLERISGDDKIKSRGGKPLVNIDPFGAVLTNSKLGYLVAQLNHYLQNSNLPVIDATEYTEPIDLILDTNITNVDSLRKSLQKYDLDLIEKDYEIEVLVIKDNKPSDKKP